MGRGNRGTGTTGVLKENVFVGPKLQKQLETLHEELSRVADYGVLTLLSKPLFWMLDSRTRFVRNWGLAIILVTFLLKLLFYPLVEKAGRSMARMPALAPRMKVLQEPTRTTAPSSARRPWSCTRPRR